MIGGIARISRMRGLAWIFDLDNTLHNAMTHALPRIDRAMTAYVARHVGLDEANANALRMRYWKRYGATILGLMRHHGVDPKHFLRETHVFPDLRENIDAEHSLRATLYRLPGRKYVFSNAPMHYAHEVLNVLGVRDLFVDVLAIEHTGYRPKPDVAGYLRLTRRHHLQPRRCIMVDDHLDNLLTAKRLGMSTVWMKLPHAGARVPGYVDHTVRRMANLPVVSAQYY